MAKVVTVVANTVPPTFNLTQEAKEAKGGSATPKLLDISILGLLHDKIQTFKQPKYVHNLGKQGEKAAKQIKNLTMIFYERFFFQYWLD